MAAGNPDFGVTGLIATTIQHYIPKLVDNAFSRTPLLHILKEGGIPSQNGRSIVQPLLYGETSAKGSFSDLDVFDAPTRDGITAAEYPWKQYYASIVFSGLELAQNSGKEAILSLLKARLMQAELSIAEDLNRMLFGDGTGNGGKDFHGLKMLVGADGNVVGGIDRADADNAWWRPNVDGGAAATSLGAMRTAFNNAVEGVDNPTHIITTQAGFEAYEGLLEDTVRHEDTKMGDAGFQNLLFKNVPIVFDRAAQDGHMYFINRDYMELVSLDGVWFDVSDWLIPVNQNGKYKNIFVFGNLTLSNSSRQSVLTGLTDA